MSQPSTAIYEGRVSHLRLRPKRHRLDYRVFSMLVDLDDLEETAKGLRLLSLNRVNLFSLWTRDQGDGSETPLKTQIRTLLERAGLADAAANIQMLCYPRILGYVFNPLSVFYCRCDTGALGAIIYEVHNTFGERHCYVLPVNGSRGGVVAQTCDKAFYVSPFISMEAQYRFRMTEPGSDVTVGISEVDREGPLLEASFTGRARPLTDRTLLRLFSRYPLMTFKVIAGIHWEALRLFAKRVPLFRHPETPRVGVTLAATPAESD